MENISKYNVTDRLKLTYFYPNEKIISFGDLGQTLYIIKIGSVSCRIIGNQEVRKWPNNDYFVQNAILIDTKRGCDVIAIESTRCFELSRCDLIEGLGIDYINIILFSFFVYSISKNNYLNEIFIESKHNELFKVFKIRKYHIDEYISASQEMTNKRIIIDGSLCKDSNQIYAKKGDIKGEEIFKDNKLDLSKSVFTKPDCIGLEAEKDKLAQILHINLTKEKQ